MRSVKISFTAFFLAAAPAFADTMPQKPSELAREVGIEQKLGQSIPKGLVFRDEAGRNVPLANYFGQKPAVLALVYYECPMLCSEVLNGLLKSLRTITFNAGPDFNVVVVSIDPTENAPLAAAKKDAYVKSYKRPAAETGWHFLTGEAAAIQSLAESVGFRYKPIEGTQDFAHAGGIMVLTPHGELSKYFYGVDFAPRDLRLALVEASSGEIGTLVDQFLLLCYHYDPAAGTYTLAISRFLQAAGAATALAIGGAIWLMLRRERRMAQA